MLTPLCERWPGLARGTTDRMSVVDQLSTHAVGEPWEMLTVSGYMRFDDYTDEDFMSPSREVRAGRARLHGLHGGVFDPTAYARNR